MVNSERNLIIDNLFSDVPQTNELPDKNVCLFVTLKKKNKWQIPHALIKLLKRIDNSRVFGFRKEGTIVSYVLRKNKNVVLISFLHFEDALDESTGPLKKT